MRNTSRLGLIYVGLVTAYAIFGTIVPALFIAVVLAPFLLIGFVLSGIGHIIRR